MTSRLPELERQLIAAAERRPRRHRLRAPRLAGRRRAIVVAIALGLLAAGVAAAGSGLLPVGTEVPVRQVDGPYEPRHETPRIVVATGDTPVHGRWQMYWSTTDVGDCLAVQLLDEGPHGGVVGEGCGDSSTFTAASIGPPPSAPAPETIVHGRVPAGTGGVQVRTEDGRLHPAEIYPGPDSVPGDFFLVAFPGQLGLGQAQQLDGEGRPAGFPIDVGGTSLRAPTARRLSYLGARRIPVADTGRATVRVSCPRSNRGLDCAGSMLVQSGAALDTRTWPPPRPETFARVEYRIRHGAADHPLRLTLTPSAARRLRHADRLDAVLVLPSRSAGRQAIERPVVLVRARG